MLARPALVAVVLTVVLGAASLSPLGARAAGSASSLFLLDAPGARALGPDDLRARPAAFAAPVRERLRYAFSYWGVPLGTASIEVKRYLELDGRRVAHVVAKARTHAAFDWLYRVRDRAEALIDLDALRTLRSRSWMEHGGHRVYEEIDFDWRTHWVRVLRERRHSGRGRELVFDFGPFAHDPLDLIYTVRSYAGPDAAPLDLPVYASKKIQGLRLEHAGHDRITNKALGTVDALRIRPEARLDGRPRQDEGRGVLWVATEGPAIPLRLVGWFRGSDTFRVGGLKAELVEYVPHAPGWEGVRGRPVPRRNGAARSIGGRPTWEAPKAVLAARRDAGYTTGDARFRFPPMPDAGPFPRPQPTARWSFLRPGGESATPGLLRGGPLAHTREGR